MGWTKTVKFVILNPENPTSDLVFSFEDWIRVESLLQDQPLSPDFLEVEYEAEYTRGGRLKRVELTNISDDKYKEKYNSEEVFTELSRKAWETRWILTKAVDIAPDDVKITVDVSYKFYVVRIYANSELLLEFYDRSSYRLVKLHGILPETVRKKIEEYLFKKGFKRGEYGGIISKIELSESEKKQLIEDLKSIIEKNKQEILEKFREEKVRARSMLLWVDDWDPDKTLEDDVLNKLEGREEEEEEVEEEAAEEETVTTEEIGKKILEETEKVEVELEEAETETTATAKEEAEEKPRKTELVKIYLLKMRLPSRYLVQQVRIEKNGEGYREIRDFSKTATLASRLEGVRRTAYERIARHFVFIESYGVWIAVTSEAVERAREVSKWIAEELRTLKIDTDRYFVKAIPIYLETSEARELLSEAVRLLESEKLELEEKIREAENAKKRSALKKLEKKLEYKQALLESFRKYLEQLG